MTDWTRVHAYASHTYVESFPITSFLLKGVSFTKDIVKTVNINDILQMSLEPNQYDNTAIVIKKGSDICGYVPKELKEKIMVHVPSSVKVIDKRLVENNIYSLRVDICKVD